MGIQVSRQIAPYSLHIMHRRSTALVIGVSKYPVKGALQNPANDATDIAAELQDLGFSVLLRTDCTTEDVDRALESFRDNLNSNDVGLFYFAGHAMQFKGENYLNTIDTSFADEISAKHSSIPLNQVIDLMASCSNSTNLIVLDACRDNPFLQAWHRSVDVLGLAHVHSPEGTLIAYATSPGQRAKDGIGRNGRYTEALLKHIKTPDIPIEDLFKRVRNTLKLSTNSEQISWEHTSLTGDFFFNMSPGRRMALYSTDAIADSQFLLKPSSPVKDAIAALKSHNWYTQNPALTSLTFSDFSAESLDSLFVLGRNIYQAACGGAKAAASFIRDFRNKTAEVSHDKQKAILDGMLFEVFFNSKGELRKDFKTSKFEELFELKKIPDLEGSFSLLSEVLTPYQSRFYVLPGRTRLISVDVKTDALESGERLISGIFVDGANTLRKASSDDSLRDFSYPIKHEKLVQQISVGLLVPSFQLTVTPDYDPVTAKLLLPGEAGIGR